MIQVLWLWLACSEIRILSLGGKSTDESTESDGVDTSTEPNDDPTEPSGEPSAEPSGEPSQEPGSEPDSAPTSEPDDPYDGLGESPDNPIMAGLGDVVINEVMIDPVSVGDADAEWVELLNLTDMYLDLRFLRLKDNGVDNYAIDEVYSGSMIMEPNGYLLLCANGSFWDNGGVDCHGTFLYQTFGGGFGLSNAEDEVILLSVDNVMLDRFDYPTGFAVEGVSMGVDVDFATPNDNDDINEWCEQFGFLPMGDNGTPNAPNSMCF